MSLLFELEWDDTDPIEFFLVSTRIEVEWKTAHGNGGVEEAKGGNLGF